MIVKNSRWNHYPINEARCCQACHLSQWIFIAEKCFPSHVSFIEAVLLWNSIHHQTARNTYPVYAALVTNAMADSHKRKRSVPTVLSAQVCSPKSIRFTSTNSASDSDILNSSTEDDVMYISSGSSLDSSVVPSFGEPSSARDFSCWWVCGWRWVVVFWFHLPTQRVYPTSGQITRRWRH